VSALALAGCPGSNGGQGGAGSGSGPGPGTGGPAATSCEDLRPKLEQMYRAEAQAKEPKRVEEAVADNTTMVLNDCAKAPAKVVACINGVTTVADLESRCLAPLDEEGTEGDALRGR
jgi:hypothetical protein